MGSGNMAKRASAAAAADLAQLAELSKKYRTNMEAAAKAAKETTAEVKKQAEVVRRATGGPSAAARRRSAVPAFDIIAGEVAGTAGRSVALGGGPSMPKRPAWDDNFRPLSRQEAEAKYRELGAFDGKSGTVLLGGGAAMPPPPGGGGGNGGGASFGRGLARRTGLARRGGGAADPYAYDGDWTRPGAPPARIPPGPGIVDGSVVAPNGGDFSIPYGKMAGGAFAASVARTRTHINSDLLANRTAMASSGGYNKQAGADLNLGLTRDAYIDDADRYAGVMRLRNFGGFAMNSPGMSRLGAGARTDALLNPMLGFAGAARVATENISAPYFNMMRMTTGIETVGPGGTPRTTGDIAQDMVRQLRVDGGNGVLSEAQVQAGFGVNGQGRLHMQRSGASDEQIEATRDYLLESAKAGRYVSEDDVAGSRDQRSRNTMLQSNRERTTAEQEIVTALLEPLSKAYTEANQAMTEATQEIASILRNSPLLAGGVGGALGIGGSLAHGGGGLANSMGRSIVGGVASGAAFAGGMSLFRQMRNGAPRQPIGPQTGAMARYLGMAGRFVPGIGVAATLGMAQNAMNDEPGQRGTGERLGNAAATVGKYAATGAAFGAMFGGPLGAGVGAVGGTVLGSGKSIYDWYKGSNQGDGPGRRIFASSMYPETGDGPGNSRAKPIQKVIDLMARSGIPHRITNRDVGAGPGSYHSSGEAVDIAGARPNDPDNLRQINHFLAKSLGSKATELIYTGPGGINLHEGKPKGSWGGSIDAKHKDHVHIAVRGGGKSDLVGSGIGGVPRAEAGDAKGGGHQNGRLPDSALASIGGGHKLRPDAAAAWKKLTANKKIGVTDSYRSYAAQVELKKRKPRLAGKPGTSNHGWGLALDLVVGGFGSDTYKWLMANGPKFGWVNPKWAQKGGSKPEPWHWEYVGGGSGAASPTAVDAAAGTSSATGTATTGTGRNPYREAVERTSAMSVAAADEGFSEAGRIGSLLGSARSAVRGAVSAVGGFLGSLFGRGDDDKKPTTGKAEAATSSSAGGGVYSAKQIAALARGAGFRGEDTLEAVGVALAESSGRPNAVNINTNAKGKYKNSKDQGLWQINNVAHPDVTNPMDPAANAQAAFRISKGGANWSPWVTWKTGAAQKKMTDARKQLTTAELGDGPGWGGVSGAEVGDGPGWAGVRGGDTPASLLSPSTTPGGSVSISRGGSISIAKVEVNLTTPQVSNQEAERIGKMVVDEIARQARMKELSR